MPGNTLMNGAHDLGGKHGFGKIDRQQQDNFASEWEEKVFALTLACGMLGRWNLDQSRYAREQMDPAHYLNSSYYEHWLSGLEQLLVEKNLLTRAELESGIAETTGDATPVDPVTMQRILATGAPTLVEQQRAAVFNIADRVVVKMDHPTSHTRVPGYVMGKVGQIVAHHGAHVFADEHASSGEKVGEHLYGVRFDAKSLWGSADASGSVTVDLFEPYLLSIADYQQQLEQQT